MRQLRLLAVVGVLWFAAASAAHAQATIFESTVPIAVGDSVRAMVQYPNSTMGIGQVEVTGYYADDITTYWRGSHLGADYVYDVYTGFWKPAPVTYEGATLDFQGQALEGWV